MTWTKICGTTNLEDALIAVEAGADALGFVFYQDSPRNVSVDLVRKIVRDVPGTIEKVGVFVNESFDYMEQVAAQTGLTGIQVHVESGVGKGPEPVNGGGLKKYLVLPASSFFDSPMSITELPSVMSADAIFLDSGTKLRPGGTGTAFDWKGSVPIASAVRGAGLNLVVAGGLTPSNVTEAIDILKPWGVDVVSGVESAPGRKDPDKIFAFISAVRRLDKKE